MSSQPISNAAPGVGTSPGSWTERLKLLYKGDASSAAGRWLPFAPYAALMVVAAVMRLWDLDLRAMHHDESLHAYFAFQLSSGAGYQHDPMMHGPLQMEATAGLFRLLGDSDFTARLLYAIAGVVLVGMPYFFRQRLGNLGALLVAVMFLFSPTLLYFSRFARNDILMAVFTFGLVITMWRYLDEGKNKYLYLFAGLLALAFATKETAYVVTVALGLYLFGVIVIRNWSRIARGVMEGEVSPPVALARLVRGAWSSTMVGLRLDDPSRPAILFLLLATLTLPFWSALAAILQDTPLLSWTGLVLSSPEGEPPPIGSPVRGGLVIAFLIVTSLIGVSFYFGAKWSWRVWWKAAAIFFGITIVLYSTFFTNFAGLGSGFWRSLGYWVAQQEAARGGQPFYYYLVIGPVYEFLPMVFAIAAGVYYMTRRDEFGRFLVFWTVATFLMYTIASEKMPWLLVNITLPAIVLAGKFLGEIVEAIEWRRLVRGGGLAVPLVVPILIVLLWRLAFIEVDLEKVGDILLLAGAVGFVVLIFVLGYLLARRTGYANFAAFAAVPVFAVLMVLTIRAGWYASYENADVPVEMLVYTQTSPDLVLIRNEMEAAGEVLIDNASGFSWPWAWYLRNHPSKSFPSYDNGIEGDPSASVFIVHTKNRPGVDAALTENYTEALKVKHRWWFPENYKGLSFRRFVGSLFDRQAWRNVADYFLYRKLSSPLGSEDAFVYFNNAFHQGLEATDLPTFGR